MQRSEPRPLTHMRQFAHKYPGFFQNVENLRQEKRWPCPGWCYAPVPTVASVLRYHAPNLSLAHSLHDAAVAGALAPWRATQGIYRFDHDVFEALTETPLTGALHTSLLKYLPEWCVYVEVPPTLAIGLGLPAGMKGYLRGFYAGLGYCALPPEEEYFDLLADFDTDQDDAPYLYPIGIRLGATTLEAAIADSLDLDVTQVAVDRGIVKDLQIEYQQRERHAYVTLHNALFGHLLPVVLYLCSVAADIRDAKGIKRQPANPQPVKTKRGERLFAPSHPTTWEVGWRIGAKLRAAQAPTQPQVPSADVLAHHASPRAHIRRAHWHHYWTDPGRTKLVLRWVHPVLVGTGSVDDIVPTFRDITV